MDTSLNFDSYLNEKKIDSQKFKSAEPDLFQKLNQEFDQISPDSFTAQKLFLINPIRRKYQLDEKPVDESAKPKMALRPKFKKP